MENGIAGRIKTADKKMLTEMDKSDRNAKCKLNNKPWKLSINRTTELTELLYNKMKNSGMGKNSQLTVVKHWPQHGV